MKLIAKAPKSKWDGINHVLDVVYSVGWWKVRDVPGWRRVDILDRMAELMEENKEDLINSLVFSVRKTSSQSEGGSQCEHRQA